MAHTILLAEDDYITCVDLCDTVQEAGYRVDGPFADLSSAMLALQKVRPDVAILDRLLNDGSVLALAEKLSVEQVPIIFHGEAAAPEDWDGRFPTAAHLPKPCPPARMIATIHRMLAKA